MTINRCELHEISNCAICSGLDKQHERSLQDPLLDSLRPTGPTIAAHYPGQCARCGQSYNAGVRIQHSRDEGWISLECCG